MDVLAAVAAQARRHPHRTAHTWSGGSLTWAELWDGSGRLAGALAATVVDRGTPIAVHAHKQSLALVCMLACVRAGLPYVPLDDSIAPDRLARTLSAARTPLLLAVSPVPADAVGPGIVCWDAEAIVAASGPIPDPDQAVAGDEIFYVIFTSGSTGEPKGVCISAANLGSFLAWIVAGLPAGTHTFLNQAPWSFDLSVMDTWPSLVTGGTLVSLDRDQVARPADLQTALAASGTTVWVSTPSFAALCLALPAFDANLVPVRTFLFCGETLPARTAAALLDRFPDAEVHNTYGPTEATVAVTGLRITREVVAEHPVLPVGRPKPGCTITIRTPSGEPVAPGASGEIWIHGDTVSAGYLGRPDLTARVFAPVSVDGVTLPTYRTGDAGRLDGDQLFFGGRLDNQIKLHGYRIELGDIEANLGRLPQVAACVVAPRRSDADGPVEHLEAIVQLADPDAPRGLATTLALRRSLGTLLPAYMVPKAFRYVDEIPMTANGKVDRRAFAEG